jgi:hypothetical protein
MKVGMDEFVELPPTTALDAPSLSPRSNQLFQGVLAFLAVVGIGSAATLILFPPTQLRVITIEKRITIEKEIPVPAEPAAAVAPPVTPVAPTHPRVAARTPKRKETKPPAAEAKPAVEAEAKQAVKSDDCGTDPLCGLDNLKE